jgi:hypothetical protein
MFKALELKLNRQTSEATEREKDKKSRMEYHARREAVLPIINRLEKELESMEGG